MLLFLINNWLYIANFTKKQQTILKTLRFAINSLRTGVVFAIS